MIRCQHLMFMRQAAFNTKQTVKISVLETRNRNFSHLNNERHSKTHTVSLLQPLNQAGLNGILALPISLRNLSTDPTRITTVQDVLPDLGHLPDVPVPPVIEPSIVDALTETSLQSLGLGGWTPIGIVQQTLEFFHLGCDLPWWGAIALGTVVVRLLMFPLVVISQRNAAKMNNYMPQMQTLQLKMTEARQSGNKIETMRYTQELMMFMKEKQLNPLKNMIVPFVQAPFFISFFIGLRRMANAPVESMATGGVFWFTDLTVPDPYYILPLITSATFYLTIELGTDSAKLNSQNLQTMKYVLRALPLMILPFTLNFPGAILTYWACSNFISLAQVGFLRIPKVRTFFKIDQLIEHNKETLPMKKKGFVEGIKESWTNMKISKELEERQRVDEIRFHKAGKGPLVKTYKFDPTKPRPANAIEAKKKM